jgi:hypothetical protein
MRFISVVAWLCACITGVAEEAPFATDKPVTSPHGTFSIRQHLHGDWSTTIHFQRIHAPDIRFIDVYPWPGLFYVSPDDCWMLDIQKSGSGDNISFLFRVDSEGHFWRMEPGLGELAFAFLEKQHLAQRTELYHTGITFDAWDLPRHRLLFTVHGSRIEHSGEGIDIPLVYDLQQHTLERR